MKRINLTKTLQLFICTLLCLCIATVSYASKNLLPDEQNTIDIFKRVSPLVVYVHRIKRVMNSYYDAYEVRAGTGSGFVWDKAGHIVTNYHVIRSARSFAVSLSNGLTVRAKIIGAEPRKDIAVLQVTSPKALKVMSEYPHLNIANSNDLQVGQKTIAIGNPFGFDRTITTGIISALGRALPGVAGTKIHDMIQTDASINPGNSGGPLLDSHGDLMGMNTMIYSKTGTSNGIGFAVPSNSVKYVVDQIIKYGRVIQPAIGVHRFSDAVAKNLGVVGVIVAEIMPDSPAEEVGLRGTTRDPFGRLIIGDIIVGINGKNIKNYDDLYNNLSKTKVGDTIDVTVKRNNKMKSFKIKTFDLGTKSGY